jgi:hypothetical protein
MDLMERTNERRRSIQKDRLEHKLDDAIRENVRLEQANGLLREELERDERERDHMWAALGKGARPRRSRLRRVMVLSIGVGAAYVAGAKAGRARYDQIMSWWERTRGRAKELQDGAQRTVTSKANEMGAKAERMTNDVADTIETTATRTSDTIETGGRRAAETVRSTGKDGTDREAR